MKSIEEVYNKMFEEGTPSGPGFSTGANVNGMGAVVLPSSTTIGSGDSPGGPDDNKYGAVPKKKTKLKKVRITKKEDNE